MHKRFALLILMALAMCAAFALPATANAASPKIITPTKAEDTAYNRCLNAAMSYKTKPEVIAVSIKDLNLNMDQVVDLETRLHSNGELWWINTFGLGLSTTEITMPCKYDDATIDSMRKKFEAAVAKALKYVGPGMDAYTRVHMMHDYVIRFVSYEATYKNAYEGLVNKRGDCFGYTLTEDVLLRRLGYKTDVAFNNDPNVDHSWNLVQLGDYWYHVDTTWDRYYTFNSSYYEGTICHKWMLQADSVMNMDDHCGWEAHNRCKNAKFQYSTYPDGGFADHCNDYKKIVRSFAAGGLKYKVIGVKKVAVLGVPKAKLSQARLYVPDTVKYKKVVYTVCGIQPNAFKDAKAKALYVNATAFSKARVKNSLAGSKITKLWVKKGKLAAYKKYFTKANCGKKVSVKSATKATLLRVASVK